MVRIPAVSGLVLRTEPRSWDSTPPPDWGGLTRLAVRLGAAWDMLGGPPVARSGELPSPSLTRRPCADMRR